MRPGDKVSWSWGQGTAEGTVRSVLPRKVTRRIKGAEVTRGGTRADLAVYVEQECGGRVLKLASELGAW